MCTSQRFTCNVKYIGHSETLTLANDTTLRFRNTMYFCKWWRWIFASSTVNSESALKCQMFSWTDEVCECARWEERRWIVRLISHRHNRRTHRKQRMREIELMDFLCVQLLFLGHCACALSLPLSFSLDKVCWGMRRKPMTVSSILTFDSSTTCPFAALALSTWWICFLFPSC